ncbi:COX15/CtaA family protein [Alkalicoccobacillus murimartini]|uniref:Heme A synthase n=1 Tax=Alkalicoccobacillus murimartini TaxID=171685 RepID=A0ABT9YF67_9BACI|nr:heme A synthase [Alkalicoccobacillus murimartini]MDQ0206482.1 cytochrome c oxidase assembly protein subunit 15 [Alkalicoccobacillus murimartini]
MHKRFKFFGVITALFVLLVLIQGALVSKTGSGEGCGDTWPLCFGEVVPLNPTMETIIEYSHRIVSGLAGLLVIILAFWAWKQLKHIREARFLAFLSVFMIILQGLMGAGAVVFGQQPLVMALHFGFSALSLSSVVLLIILSFEDSSKISRPTAPKNSKGLRRYVLGVLLYCYAVIYTGAFVKHTDSTLACAGFPTCNGKWIPDAFWTVAPQYFHRIFGTIMLISLIILVVWIFRKFPLNRTLKWLSVLSMLMVIGQFTSGITIVLSLNQYLEVGMTHAILVSLLFTCLAYMTMILLRKPTK